MISTADLESTIKRVFLNIYNNNIVLLHMCLYVCSPRDILTCSRRLQTSKDWLNLDRKLYRQFFISVICPSLLQISYRTNNSRLGVLSNTLIETRRYLFQPSLFLYRYATPTLNRVSNDKTLLCLFDKSYQSKTLKTKLVLLSGNFLFFYLLKVKIFLQAGVQQLPQTVSRRKFLDKLLRV